MNYTFEHLIDGNPDSEQLGQPITIESEVANDILEIIQAGKDAATVVSSLFDF